MNRSESQFPLSHVDVIPAGDYNERWPGYKSGVKFDSFGNPPEYQHLLDDSVAAMHNTALRKAGKTPVVKIDSSK